MSSTQPDTRDLGHAPQPKKPGDGRPEVTTPEAVAIMGFVGFLIYLAVAGLVTIPYPTARFIAGIIGLVGLALFFFAVGPGIEEQSQRTQSQWDAAHRSRKKKEGGA